VRTATTASSPSPIKKAPWYHATLPLTSRGRELADKERRLAKKELQELATMRKMVEELKATWAVEAQKVWDFLGQTEAALAPLGFSPLCSEEPVREVTTVPPMLDSMGAKMLTLEEVVSEQLEAEGHVLAEKVAEHMLTCFESRDPNISLELVVHGPTIEIEEAARGSVQEVAKIAASRFQRKLKGA
jgi:hypothetical protein